MSHRINRAIALLESGQPIYYVGGHSGHVLTHAQGLQDARNDLAGLPPLPSETLDEAV